MHAHHADEVLVRRRQRAKPHEGQRRGRAGQVNQIGQQLRGCRPSIDHTAAGINQRLLGIGQQIDSLFDFAQVALDLRVVTAMTRLGGRQILTQRRHDILGQIHHDRSRPATLGDMERFVDGPCQILDLFDQVIMLGAGTCDADGISFLERIVADQMCRNLAGQTDHRNRIHQRIGQAGHTIGCTGT